MVNGVPTCRNDFVDEKDLEKAFVLAFKEFIIPGLKHEKRKTGALLKGSGQDSSLSCQSRNH